MSPCGDGASGVRREIVAGSGLPLSALTDRLRNPATSAGDGRSRCYRRRARARSCGPGDPRAGDARRRAPRQRRIRRAYGSARSTTPCRAGSRPRSTTWKSSRCSRRIASVSAAARPVDEPFGERLVRPRLDPAARPRIVDCGRGGGLHGDRRGCAGSGASPRCRCRTRRCPGPPARRWLRAPARPRASRPRRCRRRRSVPARSPSARSAAPRARRSPPRWRLRRRTSRPLRRSPRRSRGSPRPCPGSRAAGTQITARTPNFARAPGDRLPVVAGARGDDAAPPLRRAEARDEVDPAANLEDADRLMVLVLDVGLAAEQLVERGIAMERRAARGVARCARARRGYRRRSGGASFFSA